MGLEMTLQPLPQERGGESLVTEDPLFYYVHTTPGTVHVQRKQPIRATDSPLNLYEETIIIMCKVFLSARSEKQDNAPSVDIAMGGGAELPPNPEDALRSPTRELVPVVRTCDDCGADIFVGMEPK